MDLRTMRMDTEFDQYMAEMKPYLLNLPKKTERQRCALWLKKLCEPVGSSTARKNRNQYAKLLLRMLKRGNLEGPFSTPPDCGPLKSLPSYMCVFLDETNTSSLRFHKELNSSTSESDLVKTSTPEWVKEELPFSSLDLHVGREENISPVSSDDGSPRLTSFPQVHRSPEKRFSSTGISKVRDDKRLLKVPGKEMELKIKLLEAEFHEEKLNLQHKHDLALQKVLNRKNAEIDDLKRHYKNKEKESEESKKKLEKKAQTLAKEAQSEREAKDRQIEDLSALVDETRQSLMAEYEDKISNIMADMEKEKYELQKLHTRNIQQLLDDTNQRLTTMEEEYNSQTQATKVVVGELEHHVSQLTQETESLASNKQMILAEKHQLEIENSSLTSDVKSLKKKCVELQSELTTQKEETTTTIRNMQTKYDANMEYMKQEEKVSASRAQETIRDLEDQLQSLKHALQDSDQQRTRELREKESLHQQDVMSLQHLHEKQMHNLRSEWDQDRLQHNRVVKNLEETVREKDDQIVKLTVAQKQCMTDAENAIEAYKKQVSESQQKVYADMRNQLEKLESDLAQSGASRDHLQVEYQKQLEEIKDKHSDEMNELKAVMERDRSDLTQRFSSDRDALIKDYERQLSLSESRLREALEQQEKVAEERRSQHQEVVSSLEQQLRDLREELVSANALRRQQLVELGLLREEERQKASRDHDMAIAKLEAEIDRQRMELHQQHAAELERNSQKMKKKVEQIEEDYRQRLERSHERLLDAQNKESSMREAMVQSKNDADEQILKLTARFEDEKNKLKMQLSHQVMSVQSELEKAREDLRCEQRQFQQTEFELKNELSRAKIDCEEKMTGLLPKSLKLDLEETIASLRSQVKSLQQRVEVLQEEEGDLDHRISLPSNDSPLLLT